jgi:hypothetical protein
LSGAIFVGACYFLYKNKFQKIIHLNYIEDLNNQNDSSNQSNTTSGQEQFELQDTHFNII